MVFRFMWRPLFDVWLLTQALRSYGRLLQVNEGSPHQGLREHHAVAIRPS